MRFAGDFTPTDDSNDESEIAADTKTSLNKTAAELAAAIE
jgi:hypothetical protein